MKRTAVAFVIILSLGVLSPAYADDGGRDDGGKQSCPVVPPVIQTVYVNVPVPGPTVYVDRNVPVPGPTVYLDKPVPGPTVYVNTPSPAPTVEPIVAPTGRAHEIIHTVYRTQYVPTDKVETIVALAKLKYAYQTMRSKYLALYKAEKKEKK